MKINLDPARGHSEPFKIYQSRRKANAIRVAAYLRGRFVWTSCAIETKQKRVMSFGELVDEDYHVVVPVNGTLVGKCPDRKHEKRMF